MRRWSESPTSWFTRHERDLLLSLVAIGVVLRALLVVKAPPYGYVWDFYHEGVGILVREGRLPVAADCWQCYHPPLFYLLGWPFYTLGQWIDSSSTAMALRLLGVLSILSAGAVTWYGYRLLRLAGCEGASLVIGTALLLISPLLFISAYGPDADILLAAILSAFIYHLTRVSARHDLMAAPGTGPWLILGMLAGLAAATKYSGLTALLTAGALTAVALVVGRDRARVVRHGLIVLVVAVTIGAWKYVDNATQHGTPLFANGSASEGLAFELPSNAGRYEFTSVRLADLWALFGLRSEEGELTTFPVYRSVITTLHAQAWSDMSFFSVPSRHGAPGRPYGPRRAPIWLIKAVVLLGFVPELLAVIGIVVTIRHREFWPMAVFTVITVVAYVVWFLPQTAWALKSKYLLSLAAPLTVYAMAGQDWLWRHVRPVGWITAAALIALVLVGHVYLYAFAAGRI